MNGEEMKGIILVTSDIHGYIQPIDYRTGEETPSGLAKLAALMKEERKKSPDLLLIDNGDMLQGSPFAAFAAANGTKSEAHPCIKVMNELGYDAAVPGNHEFNFGRDKLQAAVSGSEFPWLAANIVSRETGEPAFGPPYVVKQLSGKLKVAILGITTHYIPHWENPIHIAGLEFRDALESAKEWTAYIQAHEHPDLLIVSYHGGFERDLDSGEAAERLTGENQAYAICTEVPGIDVLITGHQHRCMTGELNGVAIIQTGCNGQALGRITVDFGRRQVRCRVIRKSVHLLEPNLHTAPEEQVMMLTDEVERGTQEWLDQPIGRAEGDLSICDPFECRRAPHPFVHFIHQVQLEATGAELSVASLLSEESKGFEAIITMRDVLSAFVYPNTLRVLRLTGEDIRLALEQSAAYFELDQDGQLTVSEHYLKPKAQHYNYDMWAGIEYDIDLSFPVGGRITRLTRNGEELDRNGEYTVVMNSYRAGGGGNYEMFRGKPLLCEGAADMAELAAEYIRSRGIIAAINAANWRIIWH